MCRLLQSMDSKSCVHEQNPNTYIYIYCTFVYIATNVCLEGNK